MFLENEHVYNVSDKSYVFANSILVSPAPESIYVDTEYDVFSPNDNNGSYVNIKVSDNQFAVSQVFEEGGETFRRSFVDLDAQLMPGKIIPWIEDTTGIKNATEAYKSNDLSLLINRDKRGHASGTLYLSDGESKN